MMEELLEVIATESANETPANPLEQPFYEQLFTILKAQRVPKSTPRINKTPLNLFKLYTEVTNRGGYTEDAEFWREIAPLFVNDASHTAHATLKKQYAKYLSAYESKYFVKDSTTPPSATLTSSAEGQHNGTSSVSDTVMEQAPTTPENPTKLASKKRKRLDPVLNKADSTNWQSPCGLGSSRGSRHSFNSILAGLTNRDKQLQETHEAFEHEKSEISKQQQEEKIQRMAQQVDVDADENPVPEELHRVLGIDEDFNESDTVVIFSKRLFSKKLMQYARELHKPKKSKSASTISPNKVLPFALNSREQLSSQLQALVKYNKKTKLDPTSSQDEEIEDDDSFSEDHSVDIPHPEHLSISNKQLETIRHFESQFNNFMEQQTATQKVEQINN